MNAKSKLHIACVTHYKTGKCV